MGRKARRSAGGGARAVFLDRDGVINKILYHRDIGVIDTPFTVDQMRLLPGAGEAIRRIRKMDFLVLVVSNQPGIAKGRFDREILDAMTRKMVEDLAREGAELDNILYCLHHPEGEKGPLRRTCDCRKPEAGLLFRGARWHGIDLENSYMVGDSISDVEAGRRAGCRTIFIGKWKCDLCRFMDERGVRPDRIAKDLQEAAEIIEKIEKGG